MARENVTQSISFSPAQLAVAKVRAESLGLSISKYIQVLVTNDILLRRPLRILSEEDVAGVLREEQMLEQRSAEQAKLARVKKA